MQRLSTRGLLATAVVATAGAQDFPIPMDVMSIDPVAREVVYAPQPESIQLLLGLDQVRMTGFVLANGDMVDLDLTRIRTEPRRFWIYVDGESRPDLLPSLDLTVWKGTIAGEPETEAMLSFSNFGISGWIRRDGELHHLLPRPDERGSWTDGQVLLTTEDALSARGMEFVHDCQARRLPGDSHDLPIAPLAAPGNGPAATCDLRECRVAVETDYQLYQVFNDLNAMTVYVITIYTYVSDRYETQASTALTFPYVQFYTTPNDPWSSQDSGGGCVDLLNEFQQAWVGNIPGDADLAQFLSGAKLGCGVAWVDVLCNDTFNFSVCGNINGNTGFPVVQQPNNWDFMVIAHEMGHNFGASHTHNYCPPLDQCADNCTGNTQCTNQGTIMSYCHQCPGGTANITTYFHPAISTIITDEAAGCLPLFVKMDADPPVLVPPGVPTPLSAHVEGTPVGTVDLLYRMSGGNYITLPMIDQGGGSYTADLPAAGCADTPEFYFAFTDVNCGQQTHPDGAPGVVHSLEVGTLTTVFADDFEADLGWTAVNLGASTGDWQRGVPVDDPGWSYDPAADHDGSGQCYLTQNELGNTDVDNGAVRLESPSLDLTSGSPYVSYAYYLRLTNDDGSDMLLVEISSNGGSGPWIEIARHDTNGGSNWRTHAITATELAAAGVTLTADMRVRFTANDADSQSIVEAGLDAFDLSIQGCDDGDSIGTRYCNPANANSSGAGGEIWATGSDVALDNDVTLTATQLATNHFGYFLNSQTQGFVPNPGGSQGDLCLGGAIGRYAADVADSGPAGMLVLKLDLTDTPTPTGPVSIMMGETWNFQCWFRDKVAGVPTSNFTDGIEIVFN